MEAFEFKTKIKNGVIQVPKKYTQKIGKNVKVIIFSDHRPKRKDIVDDLLKHPIKVDDFKPLSRDEIYERL